MNARPSAASVLPLDMQALLAKALFTRTSLHRFHRERFENAPHRALTRKVLGMPLHAHHERAIAHLDCLHKPIRAVRHGVEKGSHVANSLMVHGICSELVIGKDAAELRRTNDFHEMGRLLVVVLLPMPDSGADAVRRDGTARYLRQEPALAQSR